MMRENRTETFVGAVVLVAALGFGLFVAKAAGFGNTAQGYDLTASFRSVEGITTGTDIRLAGIAIPNDSAVAIASEGVLGGSFVEIVPGGSFDNFAPGEEIEDTQGAISLISLLLKFVTGDGNKP
jgi:phospholipid/cholesterol/gamma-HCH transport system substrate-binding protein